LRGVSNLVKQINLFLDDDEHEEVIKAKGDMTWKEFFKLLSQIALDKKAIEKKKLENQTKK
jgi:hypothetical protein